MENIELLHKKTINQKIKYLRSSNSKKIKPMCNFFLNVIFNKKIIQIKSSSQRHLTVLAGRAQSSHKLVNTITESP